MTSATTEIFDPYDYDFHAPLGVAEAQGAALDRRAGIRFGHPRGRAGRKPDRKSKAKDDRGFAEVGRPPDAAAPRGCGVSAAGQRGRSLNPMRNSSTARAACRPSRIAQTTSD